MKRFHKLTAIFVAVLLVATVGLACSPAKTEPVATGFVALDVNPSITLTVDKDGVVLQATADNEDALVLLYGEEIEGLKVKAALDKIAALSVEMGYLNEQNNGINLSVSGSIDADAIKAQAKLAFEAHADTFEPILSAVGTLSEQVELDRIKAAYADNEKIAQMDAELYRLVKEAIESDATLTVEAAVEMSEKELIGLINKAAKTVEPYATAAFERLCQEAELAYRDAIGQATDALWLVPYNNDFAGLLTGNRKYDVHYGMVYNLYTASSRLIGAGIRAAELAAEAAEAVALPTETVDAIATALGVADEDKQAFLTAVSEDGVVTVDSLTAYLDAWFKNMTQEQQEAHRAEIEAVKAQYLDAINALDTARLQAVAEQITETVDALIAAIPEEMRLLAAAYVSEFEATVASVRAAMSGKEPLAAAYAAKAVFDQRAAEVLAIMRKDLTEQDLAAVEKSIDAVQSLVNAAEAAFEQATEQAAAQAKSWIEACKAERIGAQGAE
jgi:FtsZ-binding cell division protein ZapB